ncbi:hypothetical protein E2C01_027752 [Portunus trituberculatus]|uniref:Transmembrane protein n=1 Tax=Portunus trituberculatus TaxID=210409 RepID=A0A5B7EM61_PORTR|nr:hypothetical protein [Portunus trituberculatus]
MIIRATLFAEPDAATSVPPDGQTVRQPDRHLGRETGRLADRQTGSIHSAGVLAAGVVCCAYHAALVVLSGVTDCGILAWFCFPLVRLSLLSISVTVFGFVLSTFCGGGISERFYQVLCS